MLFLTIVVILIIIIIIMIIIIIIIIVIIIVILVVITTSIGVVVIIITIVIIVIIVSMTDAIIAYRIRLRPANPQFGESPTFGFSPNPPGAYYIGASGLFTGLGFRALVPYIVGTWGV